MNRKGFVALHEEDDLMRELLERWLGEAGYAVRASGDQPPALITVDVPSPVGARARIWALQAVYAAPISSCRGAFGAASPDRVRQRADSASKKMLPKPFTRRQLLSAVREALRGPD